jgi:adenosylcobinamide kinase / adenosylcobinamide-phosphate guanylyltransferase
MDNNKTLILGGARSGKSSCAERLAMNHGQELVYIATAEARDDEMGQRIRNHIEQRGPKWQTIEEPINIADVILKTSRSQNVLLVDCLTLWLSNLLDQGLELEKEITALIAAIHASPGSIIFVTNEVGQGIVPMNALARTFRDEAGWLNQKIAAAVDNVYFITAGLPHPLKENNILLTQKFTS